MRMCILGRMCRLPYEMGKIMPRTRNSKPLPAGLYVLATMLLLSLALAGCGGEGGDDAVETSRTLPLRITSDPEQRPLIDCDLSAVAAWLDVAHRIAAGDSVPPADCEHLLAMPAYRVVDDLRPRVVGRVMTEVFSAAPGSPHETRLKSRALVDNYLYLRDRLDASPDLPAELFVEARLDGLRDILTSVAPADAWPARISLEIFAGHPKISFMEPGRFAVDLGLAAAGDPDQIVALLAGRIFQTLAPLDHALPELAADSRDKVIGVLCRLRHDGLGAWLAHKPEVHFDAAHARLGGPPPGAPGLLDDAAILLDRVIVSLDAMLTPISDLQIQSMGARLDKTLDFNERYENLGWAMSRVIVAERGESGLHAVAGDTEAFLRAYQAAALNTQDEPALESMPPFPDDVFDDLLTLLGQP